MKGYKIIKTTIQTIILIICFSLQCNAQLPPPFDRPEAMFQLFVRYLAGESFQEESQSEVLYDGIRFARRQQCLETADIKDISQRKIRIDLCDVSMGNGTQCDRRQAQSNVSKGTIGKLKYGANLARPDPNDESECLGPGITDDRSDLYNFYKKFREFKNNPQDFTKATENFARRGVNGGIKFVETDDNGRFKKVYQEHPQTIYSSSYDNNYKKCNVGNLGYATHSNDSRVEDYTADRGGFFIPSLQSEDFLDDLSNQTCADFFLPHMHLYVDSMIAAGVSSLTAFGSCQTSSYLAQNAMNILDGIEKYKKLQKAKKEISSLERLINVIKSGKVVETAVDSAKSAAKSAKDLAFTKAKELGKTGLKTTGKVGLNALLGGALFCYDGLSNVKTGTSNMGTCYLASKGPIHTGLCMTSSGLCIGSGAVLTASCVGILAGLFPYYTQLGIKFAKANQTFQTNQMCGSEWLTWNFDSKTQQWKPDTETSYSGCLKNLFINLPVFNQSECKKYGQFTNGKLIDLVDNEKKSKFDFSPLDKENAKKADITNQYYREFWFRGIEYEDNIDGCKNPWDSQRRLRYLGYDTEYQRYYVRGPVSEVGDNKLSIDYACHRFLRNVPGYESKENDSYQCCRRKAQNSICIEEKLVYDTDEDNNYQQHKYRFCSLGDNSCAVPDLYKTKYEIFSSKKNPEYICAKTVNHCPYDHYLSGGTEKKFESFVAVSDGKAPSEKVTANFCQHLAHCAKTENYTIRIPLPNNSYLSLACRNFIGDSLFKSSLLSGGKNSINLSQSDIIVQKQSRNLTSPMVQCLKETLENYLLRKKAVICLDDRDYLTQEYKQYNICISNPVTILSPGEVVENKSVFFQLRVKFQTAIKIALTLSVAIFGFVMLFSGNKVNEMLDKKTLVVLVFKISIVSYFALGNAWESFFMKTVFEAPLQFAELAFQPNTRQSQNNVYPVKNTPPPRLSQNSDGCIFPPVDENGNPIVIVNSSIKKITVILPNNIFQIEGEPSTYFKIENDILKKSNSFSGPYTHNPDYNILSYPANKKYLRIFDTFDCKIAHLLGYSANTNVPNFLKMILVGLFSSGLGFAFMLSSVSFAFFMILIALRVVHLIVITIIVLSILVYISPLAFCCLMFKKTQHIFNQWLAQVMGYIIQPVVVFAYLGLFMTVLDNALIGDAEFKQLNSSYDGNFKSLDCEESGKTNIFGDKIMKPKTNSILCIMAENGLIENKSIEGVAKHSLQPFNLVITSFKNISSEEGKARLKVMFKLALITFIFYKIFEYISSLAASLTGAEDSTSMLNALKQNIEKVGKITSSIASGSEKLGRDMQVRGSKDIASRGFKKGKEDASSKKDNNKSSSSSGGPEGGIGGGGVV